MKQDIVISLTESEKNTLQGALVARYKDASRKRETLKETQSDNISLGFILALEFFQDVKSDIESIYEKIFNEDIRKEIKK